MNIDGLKDAVIRMLAGDRIEINTGTFSTEITRRQTGSSHRTKMGQNRQRRNCSDKRKTIRRGTERLSWKFITGWN